MRRGAIAVGARGGPRVAARYPRLGARGGPRVASRRHEPPPPADAHNGRAEEAGLSPAAGPARAASPEVWLRGPVAGVAAPLQPVAHSLLQVREELEGLAGLGDRELWLRPGGAAAVGFHLLHLAGSTDRLLTYARGEELSAAQRGALADERDPRPEPATALLARCTAVLEAALAQLRATDPATLAEPREVGRARLPSTVGGLLFHAAEHAQRHAGQAVTTAKIVRGLVL